MRLIIEKSDGEVFVYRETEKTYKRINRKRARGNSIKIKTDWMSEECGVENMPDDSYMVFKLKS